MAKDISKLVKKQVVGKDGKRHTVWVKTGAEEGAKSSRKSAEEHAKSAVANKDSSRQELESAKKKIVTRIRAIDAQPGHRAIADEKNRLQVLQKKVELHLSTSKEDLKNMA